jgi:hypothetical protein
LPLSLCGRQRQSMLRNNEDSSFTVLKTIAQHEAEIKNAIVRIQLSLPGALETLLRDAEIYKALKEAHYVTVA